MCLYQRGFCVREVSVLNRSACVTVLTNLESRLYSKQIFMREVCSKRCLSYACIKKICTIFKLREQLSRENNLYEDGDCIRKVFAVDILCWKGIPIRCDY